MNIIVLATPDAWDELVASTGDVEWIRAADEDSFFQNTTADAYFNLLPNAAAIDHQGITKPLFIHSVNNTLNEIAAAGQVCRINAWKGFLRRDVWEVAGNLTDAASAVLTAMNKRFVLVPDEPGFIAARIISMIINEAYFAKAENVSTEQEIDIAMKLGTNYPFGPFEWSKQIGLKHVFALLTTLAKTDIRYQPASLLEKEAIAQ